MPSGLFYLCHLYGLLYSVTPLCITWQKVWQTSNSLRGKFFRCLIFCSFFNLPKCQNRTPTNSALSFIDRLQVMVLLYSVTRLYIIRQKVWQTYRVSDKENPSLIFCSSSNSPKCQNRTPTHLLAWLIGCKWWYAEEKDVQWNCYFWKMWFPAFWWLQENENLIFFSILSKVTKVKSQQGELSKRLKGSRSI